LANLNGADLSNADLAGADLRLTKVGDAQLSYANLSRAIYAPASPPPNSYVAGIEGLSSVIIPEPGDVTGLVQLRKLLAEAGLPEEREATHAIESNKTRYLLDRGDALAFAEGFFRRVAFDWPVAYGRRPGLALLWLVALVGVFALIYLIPLTSSGTGGIHRLWPEGRLETTSSAARVVGQAKVERLHPQDWKRRLGRALQFSTLSAFHIGWRELNVGNWISRLQWEEYTLRATGWVRAVAGAQSLLSVYLLAMWVLTYFGRPFG
jgi:hypothetical protein